MLFYRHIAENLDAKAAAARKSALQRGHGGKTGTADKGKTGDVVVSFVAFAPADDPQIIMLIAMDSPARDTGTYPSGGAMVAPVASKIMA